ncbi:MAG: FAD-dependent oxidoreductase, partial [Proteobacteria bacterium]|nr:FAD-dependent oxidoreductase [Pseudomonadota bacterium]
MGELSCDVLVAGGGLVGATAALALSRAGLSVVLVDRAEPPISRGGLGFDPRTVALNPASVELLTELDVWRSFAPCPFESVYVCE